MTPRIRKSMQGAQPHGTTTGTGRPAVPAGPHDSEGGARRSGPTARHVFRRSRKSLRGSFRRRVPLTPRQPDVPLTPEAASAALTEVFQHLLEATNGRTGADAGGAVHAAPKITVPVASELTTSLEGCLKEVTGM